MYTLLKKIYINSPAVVQGFFVSIREYYGLTKSRKFYPVFEWKPEVEIGNRKINVLFYHISGLSFAGTEKFLQIIAKYLNKDKYNVYYMYSSKSRDTTGNIKLDGRVSYLKDYVTLIEFDYKNISNKYPYIVDAMYPNIFEIIKQKEIDLMFTAGSGYSEFPFNLMTNLPIILINIFGMANTQKNIISNICISKAVEKKISHIVTASRRTTVYIQSERPKEEYKVMGGELRKKLGIAETDVVFGRIGRSDNSIFDPIGINAFEQVVKDYSNVHYIIMSPPPILRNIVKERNIPNVHFLPPSGDEKNVWAFHYALDALAHFRLDGESFGLNIAESMVAGNPIISHKSHIWNAHLEYLDPDFSYICEKDDITSYCKAMKNICRAKEDGTIMQMKKSSFTKGQKLFIIENSINKIETIINKNFN